MKQKSAQLIREHCVQIGAASVAEWFLGDADGAVSCHRSKARFWKARRKRIAFAQRRCFVADQLSRDPVVIWFIPMSFIDARAKVKGFNFYPVGFKCIYDSI